MRLRLLLLSITCAVCAAVQPCADQPYFNYKCSQLAKYCQEPQAMRIRKSCPMSCGMCRTNSTERHETNRPATPIIFQQFNRAIKRESLSKGLSTTTTTAKLPDIDSLFEGFLGPFAGPQPKSLSVGVPDLFVSEGAPADGLKIGSLGRRLTDAQVESDLRECCRGNFIASDCLPLCSYDVEPQQIISKALSRTCSERDANIWLRCVSSSNPNNGCCQKRNVIGCENLCQARFSVLELMTCIEPYLRPILQCHKDTLLEGK